MTYYYGPVCTCWCIWPAGTTYSPCPVHGRRGHFWTTTATTSTYTACKGRHCAHDPQCFGYTINWTGA